MVCRERQFQKPRGSKECRRCDSIIASRDSGGHCATRVAFRAGVYDYAMGRHRGGGGARRLVDALRKRPSLDFVICGSRARSRLRTKLACLSRACVVSVSPLGMSGRREMWLGGVSGGWYDASHSEELCW